MFYLVQVLVADGAATEVPLTEYGTFASGSEASRAAKLASVNGYGKVQPRRIAQAGDWRPRAQAELDELDTQAKLPAAWDLPPIADHFLRRAHRGSELVSYYASGADGIINKRMERTPGRYIAEFYPELHQEDLKRYLAMVDTSGQLRFARTPEDATRVYDEGPDSCMKGDKGRYNPESGESVIDDDDQQYDDEGDLIENDSGSGEGIHVCAMYGTGDLGLAYLEDGTGRITARSVCWPDQKLHGRTYGDIARLNQKLKDEGYKQVGCLPGGAVVVPAEKKNKRGRRRFALPYFDNLAGLTLRGDGAIVTVDPNIHTPTQIWGGRDCGFEGKIMMECPVLGYRFEIEDFIDVTGGDHPRICKDAARSSNYWQCDKSKRFFHASVSRVRMNSHRSWCQDAFDADGATCPFTGRNYPKSVMVSARDGTLVYGPALDGYHKLLDDRASPDNIATPVSEELYDEAA